MNDYFYIDDKFYSEIMNIFKYSDLLCSFFDSVDYIKIDTSLKSEFSLNDICCYGYEFISERYPSMIDDFVNSIKNPNIFKIHNNKEQVDIIRLVFDRYLYYLKNNSINKARILVRDEIVNCNVRKDYFEVAYNFIFFDFAINFKSFKERLLFKSKLLSILFGNKFLNKKIGSDIKFYGSSADCNDLCLVDTNDIFSLVAFIHEYVHKNNQNNHIFGDVITENTSSCFSELPSITIENDFLEWLLLKGYISEFDFKYHKNSRLIDTVGAVNEFRDALDNIPDDADTRDIGSIIGRSVITFSYIIGTVLDPCIRDRIKNNSNYMDKLMEANDKLFDVDFGDIIKILDLDYTDDKIYDEIKNSFFNYYHDYYKVKKKTK